MNNKQSRNTVTVCDEARQREHRVDYDRREYERMKKKFEGG